MTYRPDYATLAEMRASLRITGVTDTADDAEISLAITAASRSIERATNRQFGVLSAAAPRRYTAVYDKARRQYVVSIDDLMSTTNLVVKSDSAGDGTFATTHTDYALFPLNAAADGLPWTSIVFDVGTGPTTAEGGIQVTALFGWTAVPSTIKKACLLQAARYFKRRDAPFGVAGSPEMGNELRLLSRLDPDVEVLVNDFRRWWSAF